MADTLTNASFSLSFSVATASDDADRLNKVIDSIETGSAKFPSIGRKLTHGTTGVNLARYFWAKKLTVLSGVPQTFVLGDGTLKNGRNQNVAFTRLRRLVAVVIDPDGTKRVTLQMTGSAANFIDQSVGDSLVIISDVYYQSHDYTGIVSGATDTMVITSGGSTVVLDIALVGS